MHQEELENAIFLYLITIPICIIFNFLSYIFIINELAPYSVNSTTIHATYSVDPDGANVPVVVTLIST